MTTYIIYADGSSIIKNKERRGGIGIYIESTGIKISKSYDEDNATNQRMELQACLVACRYYIDNLYNLYNSLVIRTDSMYSINCITKWSECWEKNNWERIVGNKMFPVLHLDIIKELYDIYKRYDIKFEHIRAHQKEPLKNSKQWILWNGNNIADKLAKCHKN